MKIRKGFVSNSSSSSFIVEGDSTIAQIALMMMYEIKHDWETYGSEWEKPPSFYAALGWISENLDNDEPILIPWSTNYETFIWKVDNCIRVSTCNNHDWSLLGGRYTTYEDSFYREAEVESFLDLFDMKHKTKRQFRDEQSAMLSARIAEYENEDS